jgi:HK97 family phage major capsid protein
VYHKDGVSLAAFKSLTEGTGSAGGFIVPEEFAAEVNRVVEDFGLVPKLARIYPMKYDTLNVPRLASSVSVYWPGEATAGTASQPVFEQVVLSAKTLVGITPMSNELLADANVNVVDLLVELFAEAIAGEMDKQGFAGTGSPFTGILKDTGVTFYSPTTTSTFTLSATPDNCRGLISQVKPWSLQGAAFFMHRAVWLLIQTAKASTSGDYFISAYNPVVVGANTTQAFPMAMAGSLWGYPVYLSDKLPSVTAISTPFIIFGNLKHLYVGDRQEMAVAISQDATVGSDNLFAANMSAVRVVTRKAIAVGLPAAFAVLKTTAA